MANKVYNLQADTLKAIAHPTRIEILQQLQEGERCVCEIYPALNIEQPNVSRHLSILKKEGIVSSRKEGLKVIYRVNDQRIFKILDLVTEMLKEHWDNRKKALV